MLCANAYPSTQSLETFPDGLDVSIWTWNGWCGRLALPHIFSGERFLNGCEFALIIWPNVKESTYRMKTFLVILNIPNVIGKGPMGTRRCPITGLYNDFPCVGHYCVYFQGMTHSIDNAWKLYQPRQQFPTAVEISNLSECHGLVSLFWKEFQKFEIQCLCIQSIL